MRGLAKMAVAALIVATPLTATAGDAITVPTSANDSLPVADSGFDWNTFYGGIYGTTQVSPATGAQVGLGVDLGVSSRFEFVLVGGEISLEGLTGGTVYGQAVGRAGIALSDDLIAYGAGGLGSNFGTQTDALLGGGLELAVSDSVSLDARYLHGLPLSGANPKDQLTIGANFHF